MKPWKTLSTRTVLDHGKYLRVEMHEVELPDGRTIPDWPWLITPDFVNVIAMTGENEFLLFRQTKYALEGPCLAPVGGFIDPGEAPEQAAQRELLEETGYRAERWDALGSYRVDSNRGAGTASLFLAREAGRVADPVADDLEEQELVLLRREQLEQALSDGQLRSLPWVAAVALALRHLDSETL